MTEEYRHTPDRMQRPLFDMKNKILFVHVPKVAGCSIDDALGINSMHATAMDYRDKRPNAFIDCFTFAFVRNPFDRLVSAYEFIIRGGLGYYTDLADQRILQQFNGFEDFCLRGLPLMACNGLHFRPQVQFVCSEDQQTVIVNYVGRYEQMKESWEEVKRQTGLSVDLEWVNKTVGRKDWRTYYNKQEIVDAVVSTYQQDFNVFGYSTQPHPIQITELVDALT